MRKTFTLLAAFAAMAVQAYNYKTPGTGTTYTLQSLSAIEASHVTKGEAGYTLADSVTISAGDKFQLADGDVMMLSDGVAFVVEGQADFSVPTAATITHAPDNYDAQFIRLETEGATFNFKNVTFDYVGMKSYAANNVTIDHCSFVNYHSVNSNKGPICFGATGAKLVLTNSYFTNNEFACFSAGVNNMIRVKVEGCLFNKAQTQNRNYPVLNITPGDSIIVRNNVIHGSSDLTMVGGISVANLMGISGMQYVEISGNTVDSCRYGISLTGALGKAVIKNNTLTNNRFVYSNNANYGGSGIAIYDDSKSLEVRVSGNHIENNLWGVTILGGKDVNLGKVQVDGTALSTTDPEYNEGRNYFKDNGNNGTSYDVAFASGTSYLTVYAQNNAWNVSEPTEANIEPLVWHQNDDASLGKLIFTPALTTAGLSAVKNSTPTAAGEAYYDACGRRSHNLQPGLNIVRKADGSVVKVLRR